PAASRSPPRLARDDKVPLAPRLGPVDRHVLHARAGRPAAGPGDDRVHGGALALDLGLDRAVGAVPDPAAHAEAPGLALHRAAEPHALHEAADDEVRPHRHHFSSRRRNASSSRPGTPGFFALASFEPGSAPATT